MKEASESSPLVAERAIETYFQRDLSNNTLHPNAILVDMEPKVVQKCLNNKFKAGEENFIQWSYDPKFAFYKQGGSGNNWALGYHYYGQ